MIWEVVSHEPSAPSVFHPCSSVAKNQSADLRRLGQATDLIEDNANDDLTVACSGDNRRGLFDESRFQRWVVCA